jgi:hypothetical protein
MNRIAAAWKRWIRTYWPYYGLTVAVFLPLLAPGYILTLDAVFVPDIPAPETVRSDYLWQWLLHMLNFILPSQLIEKAIFIGIVLGAAIGAHRLLLVVAEKFQPERQLVWRIAPYAAGALFAVNPFVYDRFMAGQYGVLLGYALLPWILQGWMAFVSRPARTEFTKLLILLVAVSIVSLPTLGEALLAGACTLSVGLWRKRKQAAAVRLMAMRMLTLAGLFIVFSSYWLLPALFGNGATAGQVQGFTAAHTAAFATAGQGFLEQLFTVLRLQGFWVEQHNLFRLPQDQLPGWGTIRLAVWALVVAGAVTAWGRARSIAALWLALGLTSAVLAAGAFPSFMTRIGYREPQKFAGLVALVFAVFFAIGAARLFGWARRRAERHYTTAAASVMLIIVLFTPTMYWGFAGQLRPRNYPAEWTAANAYLNEREGDFDVAFLPWHQYMSFEFAGRIIATPAPRFFDRTVIASNDPELGDITPPKQEKATLIGMLVKPQEGKHVRDLPEKLALANVRYILLAKEYDYQKYRYLDNTPGLREIRDWPALRLYENTAWKGAQ